LEQKLTKREKDSREKKALNQWKSQEMKLRSEGKKSFSLKGYIQKANHCNIRLFIL
jgi:hypothetical protein